MPVLKNTRREKFAHASAKGNTVEQAYVAGGFKANRGNAAHLNANESVQDRVAEIQGKGALKAEATVERVLKELSRIGFSDLRRVFGANVRLLRPEEWDDDTAAAVASAEREGKEPTESAGAQSRGRNFEEMRMPEYLVEHFDTGPDGLKSMQAFIDEKAAEGYSLHQAIERSTCQWVLIFSSLSCAQKQAA